MQEPPGNQFQHIAKLYFQSRYQEALKEAIKLLEKFPRSVNLYNIIGATNRALGKLDEAIEDYNKAISLKPDFAEAYNNMGNIFEEQDNFGEAIKKYEKAISLKPDFVEAYYNLGNILQGIKFKRPNKNLQKTIISLLDQERCIDPVIFPNQ